MIYLIKNTNSSFIFTFLVSCYVLFSAFSNAPGYLHSALTLPSVFSFLIIFFALFRLHQGVKKIEWPLLVLLISCILSIVLSFIIKDEATQKTFNYSAAHLWFVFLIAAFATYQDFVNNKTSKKLLRLLSYGIFSTLVYLPFEALLPFLNVDLGSFLPRVSRQYYEILAFGYYRVRGFQYESAYLAMYLNVSFAILIGYIKKYRPELSVLWVFSLTLTSSLAQIALFIFLFLFLILPYLTVLSFNKFKTKKLCVFNIIVALKERRWAFWYFFLVVVFIVIIANLSYWISWVYAFIDWYRLNLTGQSPSAISRLANLEIVKNLLVDSWPFGLGMGAIQDLGYPGITSFYLALMIQLGLFSIPFFLLIIYLFSMTIRTKNVWLVAAFIFAFAHLLIIDTFYLPQVFLPILFTFIALQQKKLQNA